MPTQHHYETTIQWQGNTGEGTSSYRSYTRDYLISMAGKPDIAGTSDPAFRGDRSRHNPEELFVASLSACHMLWYLHLCADAGIVVWNYTDSASGTMEEDREGSGAFTEVVLHPVVTIVDPLRIEEALSLHQKANKKCFIANSCNFPVRHDAVINIRNEHPET